MKLLDGPERFKAWREAQGLSQTDAGRRFGVSAPMISFWEGRRSEPTARGIIQIEKETGIPVESWVRGAELMEDVEALEKLRRDKELELMSRLFPKREKPGGSSE